MSTSEKPHFIQSLLQKIKGSVHVSGTKAGIDSDFVFLGDVPSEEWEVYFESWLPEHRRALKILVDETCKKTPDERQEYIEDLASIYY